jgi:hypothetical protein
MKEQCDIIISTMKQLNHEVNEADKRGIDDLITQKNSEVMNYLRRMEGVISETNENVKLLVAALQNGGLF